MSAGQAGAVAKRAMHEDEVPVDVATVRRLVADQFPRWRGLTVSRLRTVGTVHAIFRLGGSLVVRCPLRRLDPGVALARLRAEAAAQREFARAGGVPCPLPRALGRPGPGYAMPFAVQTWVPGRVPAVGEEAGSAALADGLASLIASLRAAPTRGRVFAGEGRGGVLSAHDDWVGECVRANAPWFDPAETGSMWARLRRLPCEDPDVMTHGDLVPGNVLVEAGRLVGVLDTAGYGPADPALELVCAWHLLDGPRRARLRAALRCSELEWERGRAWAFQQAMGLVHYYAATNPGMHELGLRSMRQLLADQ